MLICNIYINKTLWFVIKIKNYNCLLEKNIVHRRFLLFGQTNLIFPKNIKGETRLRSWLFSIEYDYTISQLRNLIFCCRFVVACRLAESRSNFSIIIIVIIIVHIVNVVSNNNKLVSRIVTYIARIVELYSQPIYITYIYIYNTFSLCV